MLLELQLEILKYIPYQMIQLSRYHKDLGFKYFVEKYQYKQISKKELNNFLELRKNYHNFVIATTFFVEPSNDTFQFVTYSKHGYYSFRRWHKIFIVGDKIKFNSGADTSGDIKGYLGKKKYFCSNNVLRTLNRPNMPEINMYEVFMKDYVVDTEIRKLFKLICQLLYLKYDLDLKIEYRIIKFLYDFDFNDDLEPICEQILELIRIIRNLKFKEKGFNLEEEFNDSQVYY
jgi:hypothetical protein